MILQSPDTTESLSTIEPAQEEVSTLTHLANGFFETLPKVEIGLVVVVVFWLLARGVRSLIHRVTPGPRDSNIGIVLGRLTFAVIVIGGVFVAAAIIFPGVTAGTLISGLSIGSIAVGFAFQDEVGIGYGDDIERAKGIVMETLNGIEGVLKDPPPDVLTWTLGESTVNLRVR